MSLLDPLAAVPGLAELRALAARGAGSTGAGGWWLVGGAVRDALLGGTVRDLDVAIEGDALAAARALVGLGVAELTVAHERFGTAELLLGPTKLNLAATRTETYERPGALPDVVYGATIQDDLRRRDFTINAIAVALDDGREVALEHARDDVEARRLRVLHDRSFEDDPTRIYRMVRYARRLDLTPDPHTSALARAAVADGALHAVSRGRLACELRLMLQEPDPAGTLAAAHGWVGGAAPAVEPDLARQALALLPPDGRPAFVLVASGAIARGGAHAQRDAARDIQWFDDSRPARRRIREITRAPELAAALRGLGAVPSAIAATVRGRPVEAIALAGALDDGARAAAEWWLTKGRHVRLEIDGSDLIAAGLDEGPAIRAALERALAGRLDGTIAPGRAAELAAALARP
jgi:tRNA nucleotidyltransferase (CCA-adding enzyme)